MKKLSIKIKSIYTLTAILVLSLCMLLFPVATKSASADDISDAAKEITVKSAYIQVSNQVNASNEISEFAIMFKAKITIDAYEVITNDGQENVKFGLLIGPTSRMANVTDYSTAKAQEFVAIANVGTRYSGADQHINFGDSFEYSYTAGIVYNQAKLTEMGINLKGAADLELSAIPYYIIDGTSYAVVDNAKSCKPREILAESFIKEQDAEISNIPEQVVNTYVGQVNEMAGEHYVCRDTNRFMSTNVVGADLTPKSVASSGDVVYLFGKKLATTNTIALDDSIMNSLPMYSEGNLVVYKADGTINKYPAKLAERVITRFADAKVGTTVEDDTKDYLATLSGSTYNSIFYVSQSGASGANVWYYGIKGKTEGLYVLANDITIPSAHNYAVAKIGNYGFMGNLAAYNKKVSGAYVSGDAHYANSAYMIPSANAGFIGEFDGRGNVIDTNEMAQYGIFPPAFNATIKNVALLNLKTSYDFGGICTGAKNTTFENVYATITSVSDYHADMGNPLCMMLDTCTLNNVVVEANAVTSTAMTRALTYGIKNGASSLNIEKGNSGYGQNKYTTGVFSFKHFPDVYTDVNGTWRFVDNPTVAAHGIDQFVDNGAKTYLGKVFTSSNITTVRYNSYISIAGDAFNGTTGTNVYTVGTSPLYVNHEFAKAPSTGADHLNLPSLDPTTKTAVFVNSTLKYNDGEQVLDTNTTDYYKLSVLVDTNGLFTINNDTTYSLGEIILRGKQTIYGADKVANMLATAETNELEVRLVTQAGWYDVADAEEMAQYVNANTDTPFDSTYWNVSNGIVTWKGLSA